MKRSYPVNRAVLTAGVLSSLLVIGCGTSSMSESAKPGSVAGLNAQMDPNIDPGTDSVVSASKAKESIDPRTLEEASAPKIPVPPSASPAPVAAPAAPPKQVVVTPPVPMEPHSEKVAPKPIRETVKVPPKTAESATPIIDVSAEKFNSDLQTLRTLQVALEKYNLRIVSVKEDGRQYIDWDRKRLNAYNGRIANALPALKRYRKAALQFLRNYDRKFKIDGSLSKADELAAGPIDILVAKVQLVDESIDQIEKMLQDGGDEDEGDFHMGAIEKFFA